VKTDDSKVTVGSSSSSAAGQSASMADQSVVVASSSSQSSASSADVGGQSQTANNISISAQAYVPLPQLRDHISPYTAVDKA